MSSDEVFLVALLAAARETQLELLIVGSTAGVLQGAPLMTQDVDILIRDTPRNRKKLAALAARLGATVYQPTEMSTTLKLVDLAVPIDVLFDRLPTGQAFQSLRSRSRRIALGKEAVRVIDMADLIASKKQAGRDKDRAQLPTLEQTLAVLKERE